MVAVAIVCAQFSLPAQEAPPERLVGRSQEQALVSSLVGGWTARVGKQDITLEFGKDGRYSLDGEAGTFTVSGTTLTMQTDDSEETYGFDIAATDPLSPLVLTLSGGDLAQPLKFSAQRTAKSPGAYIRETFGLSREALLVKTRRLIAVVVIVLVARLIISALRWLSHFAIYSEWGPLKSVYRHSKSRTMTIHSLALNILKYVVYFGALGRILNELGVNYTAYFASLSVVGLAIGFGSQGLVQDIVTGFFIIFEGQFDVGDMVEISGQTGVVEELGLRMTRLRNYLGQNVTIPNRNIALVGSYSKGLMSVRVDVAIAGPAVADKAKEIVARIGAEIAQQYRGAILSAPSVAGPLSLKSGECFVRLETGIWPQQQWVVEQQIIPRVRELFKREDIEIPADRVTPFYHMPKEQDVRSASTKPRPPRARVR